MKYTKKYMQELFHYINLELFDNMLDMPYFNVSNYKYTYDAYGWCQDYKGNTFVGIDKTNNPADFFTTMVHELIHVWQVQNDKPMNHKKEFKKWCDKAYEIFY